MTEHTPGWMGFVPGSFNYTLTHCWSRNTKPEALFHQFSMSKEENPEELVLSPRCVVAAAR